MKIALYTKRFTNWSRVPALCSQTLFNSNAIKIPFVINHISRMFFTPLSIVFPIGGKQDFYRKSSYRAFDDLIIAQYEDYVKLFPPQIVHKKKTDILCNKYNTWHYTKLCVDKVFILCYHRK